MNRQPRVCVIGSINMDLVTTTQKMPEQGETVLGDTFKTYPGGKGANQAVAAARLGAEVLMVGAIGDDTFGQTLLENFRLEGVSREGIKVIPNCSTGTASIILSGNDNRIIVSQGANSMVTPALVKEVSDQILASDVILLQFEIPMETIRYTVDFAHKHGIPVIVNPAPFQPMSKEILTKTTYFTPNEVELSSISKLPIFDSIKERIIVTKGDKGVEFVTPLGELGLVPAYKVNVKDTTGAGDTFNGALATELSRTKIIDQSIDFANAAAALSIGRLGAQGGMPTRIEVTEFLQTQL